MTPWFERVYHTEPPNEGDFEREHKSIELSDEEIILRDDAIREANKASAWRFDVILPYPLMPEALEIADCITKKKEEKSKTKKTTSTKKAKVS